MELRSARHRRRFTPEARAQWISRYRSSGLTQQQFAQQHALNLGTLRQWLYRQPLRTSRKGKMDFREVHLPPLFSPHAWAAEVSLPDGVTVRLSATASASWIESLLQAVRQAC